VTLLDSSSFRVYLRALEPDDYRTTVVWRRDDGIWAMVGSRKRFVSAVSEQKWVLAAIEDRDDVKVAACIKGTNEHIGNVYLTDIDWSNRNAGFGLVIGAREWWGQGIGTEMGLLMLNHAFRDLGLMRVYAYQLTTNLASIRLHEKCGFRHEGVLRQAVYKNGQYCDLNVMGILADEFNNVCSAPPGT